MRTLKYPILFMVLVYWVNSVDRAFAQDEPILPADFLKFMAEFSDDEGDFIDPNLLISEQLEAEDIAENLPQENVGGAKHEKSSESIDEVKP